VASAGNEVDVPSVRSPRLNMQAAQSAPIGKRRSVTMAKGSRINQATKIFPSD